MNRLRTRLTLVLTTTGVLVVGVLGSARAAWSDQVAAAGGPVTALVVAPPVLSCTITGPLLSTARISWPQGTVPTTLEYVVRAREDNRLLTPTLVGGTWSVDVTGTLLSLLGGSVTVDVYATLPGTSWTSTTSTRVVVPAVLPALSC